MSILNGNIHYDVLRAEEMPFGAEFAQKGHIRTSCGNAADADVLGDGLYILDVRDPAAPRWRKRIRIGVNPEFVDVFEGKLLLACGRQGLLEIEL